MTVKNSNKNYGYKFKVTPGLNTKKEKEQQQSTKNLYSLNNETSVTTKEHEKQDIFFFQSEFLKT